MRVVAVGAAAAGIVITASTGALPSSWKTARTRMPGAKGYRGRKWREESWTKYVPTTGGTSPSPA
ncbi:MAG: hypothetical protein QM757_38170 [Paludibaculum sp.]